MSRAPRRRRGLVVLDESTGLLARGESNVARVPSPCLPSILGDSIRSPLDPLQHTPSLRDILGPAGHPPPAGQPRLPQTPVTSKSLPPPHPARLHPRPLHNQHPPTPISVLQSPQPPAAQSHCAPLHAPSPRTCVG
jgi:hypothetical protein